MTSCTDGSMPQQSGKATGSLILGILGLLCILPGIGPLLAIILGHLARSEIKQSSEQLTGKGKATAGLVMGYLNFALCLLIIPLFIFGVFVPFLTTAKPGARRVGCAGNLKQIGLACRYFRLPFPN